MFLDSIFPAVCPVCGEISGDREKGFCRECLKKLRFVRTPLCQKCGRPVISVRQKLCLGCAKSKRSFAGGVSLLCYDSFAKEMMAQIKYRNRRDMIAPLMSLLYERCKDRIDSIQAECIIPVPVHAERLKERGYNQAELMARELSSYTGLPVRKDILLRQKKTAALKKLNPEERFHTLTEAFTAEPKAAHYQRVILMDDIYTTGSTVEICTRALQKAGIPEVYFVTVCIGEDL